MKKVLTIPDAWQNTAALFIALGDAHRQRILLAFEANERLSTLQIIAASSLSRTAVTHHLKILHSSGALQSEKIGKEVFFWIDKAFVSNALQLVLTYINTET